MTTLDTLKKEAIRNGHFNDTHGLDDVLKKIATTLTDEMYKERVAWETYQDTVESIFDWLHGENGEFPDLSQKPHYRFRSQLRQMRKMLNPPLAQTIIKDKKKSMTTLDKVKQKKARMRELLDAPRTGLKPSSDTNKTRMELLGMLDEFEDIATTLTNEMAERLEEVENDFDSFRIVLENIIPHDTYREKALGELEQLRVTITQAQTIIKDNK